jgi:multiple antibiotic resistance protein
MDNPELLSAVGLLLLTMDPLGNVPNFVSILQTVAPERRRAVVVRELLCALSLMLGFVVGGRQVMALLGIQQEAISMAGAMVLFLIAIEMILPGRGRKSAGVDPEEGEPFIVPLATPLVAGPSALATVILITSKPHGTWIGLWAVLIAWTATFCVLVSAPAIVRILRQRGARAVERLMGMLLVMLSVQMFLNGLREYLMGR